MNLHNEPKVKVVKLSKFDFNMKKGNKNMLRNSQLQFDNPVLKEQLHSDIHHKETAVMRNSFIPKTGIRNTSTLSKSRRNNIKIIPQITFTHSKFPQRKTLTTRTIKNIKIPVQRQRIYSFNNQKEITFQHINLRKTAPMEIPRANTATVRSSKEHDPRSLRYTQTSHGNRFVPFLKSHSEKQDFDQLFS